MLWNILELEWNEVTMTLNDSFIKLLTLVTIPLRDESKVRRIIKRDLLMVHIMLPHG